MINKIKNKAKSYVKNRFFSETEKKLLPEIIHYPKGLVKNEISHVSAFNYGNAGDVMLPIALHDIWNKDVRSIKWDNFPVYPKVTQQLVDKPIYDKYKLDEEFEWWWSITKIQAEILKNEGDLLGFKNHNRFLYHYGGKSGHAFKNAKGMDVDRQKILKWFENKNNGIKIKSLRIFNIF